MMRRVPTPFRFKEKEKLRALVLRQDRGMLRHDLVETSRLSLQLLRIWLTGTFSLFSLLVDWLWPRLDVARSRKVGSRAESSAA